MQSVCSIRHGCYCSRWITWTVGHGRCMLHFMFAWNRARLVVACLATSVVIFSSDRTLQPFIIQSTNIYNAFAMPLQPSTSSTVTPVAMTSEVPRSSRWSPEHREVPGAGGGWPGQSCGGWSDAADHRSSKRAAEDREFFGRKQSWFEAWHCLRHCLAHLADIKTDERFISTAADEEPIWLPGQSLQGREHDLRRLPSTLTPILHQFLHQYYTNIAPVFAFFFASSLRLISTPYLQHCMCHAFRHV